MAECAAALHLAQDRLLRHAHAQHKHERCQGLLIRQLWLTVTGEDPEMKGTHSYFTMHPT